MIELAVQPVKADQQQIFPLPVQDQPFDGFLPVLLIIILFIMSEEDIVTDGSILEKSGAGGMVGASVSETVSIVAAGGGAVSSASALLRFHGRIRMISTIRMIPPSMLSIQFRIFIVFIVFRPLSTDF